MKTKRVIFKNSQGLKLVGVLHTPEKKTKSIVIIAHGFTSFKDAPKLVKAAEEFSKAGFAALRFDFRGHGESDYSGITVAGQVDDLKSAIEFARKLGYNKIGLLGGSLGGLTSILAYDEKIKTMVLWASVTKAKTPTYFKDPVVRKELESKGYYILKRYEREFKIEKQFVTERETINQKEILSKIKCPVLLIHGDKDEEVSVKDSKSSIQYLPKESKLEIIKGATHKLYEDLDKVISLSLNWFKKYL